MKSSLIALGVLCVGIIAAAVIYTNWKHETPRNRTRPLLLQKKLQGWPTQQR